MNTSEVTNDCSHLLRKHKKREWGSGIAVINSLEPKWKNCWNTARLSTKLHLLDLAKIEDDFCLSRTESICYKHGKSWNHDCVKCYCILKLKSPYQPSQKIRLQRSASRGLSWQGQIGMRAQEESHLASYTRAHIRQGYSHWLVEYPGGWQGERREAGVGLPIHRGSGAS